MRGFKLLSDRAVMPTRKTARSAGYDLSIPAGNEIIIHPNETVKVKSDIAAFMEDNEVLLIFIRSSAGIKKKLAIANGTGIIDSDYFGNPDNGGNIILAIRNYGEETVILQPKERIAQGVFMKYLTTGDKPTDERLGGIGSTGL